MQLTYNNQSLLATGCYEKIDSGVTNFGKEAIKEMNKTTKMSQHGTTIKRKPVKTHPIVTRKRSRVNHMQSFLPCGTLRCLDIEYDGYGNRERHILFFVRIPSVKD